MVEITILRLVLVFTMSFLFGLERQFSNKSTGFGTFIFVAVGSCSIGVLSSILSPDQLLILAGGVITGIGFLGAGALIKTNDKIFGFTTAASIWIFAIIGLSVGIGQYFVGMFTYSLMWVVVVFDRFLEKENIGAYQRKVTIRTKKIVGKEEILDLFHKNKWKLINMEINKKEKKSILVYLVSAPRGYVISLRNELLAKPWLESFKIE